MKPRLLTPPLLLAAFLLSGCPDSSKLPKVPPSTPEPKAAVTGAVVTGLTFAVPRGVASAQGPAA